MGRLLAQKWNRAGIAVAAAVAAVVVSTASAQQVPFAATMTGSVSEAPCGVLTICLTGTVEGTATHLGLATLTGTATVHITFTPCDGGGVLTTFTQTATLVAANGDTLTLRGSGTACAANGHAIGSGDLTITGGTGRFAGATGNLTESIDHNLVTGAEVDTLSGTISSPGSS
jgi:hypothetical protein